MMGSPFWRAIYRHNCVIDKTGHLTREKYPLANIPSVADYLDKDTVLWRVLAVMILNE